MVYARKAVALRDAFSFPLSAADRGNHYALLCELEWEEGQEEAARAAMQQALRHAAEAGEVHEQQMREDLSRQYPFNTPATPPASLNV